jgi:tetratricopeptide (TPR) repeat protein
LARVRLTFGAASAPGTHRTAVRVPPAADWPFTYPFTVDIPATPASIVVHDIHDAFINRQGASTRLVTTQPTYWMAVLLDLIGASEVAITATAERRVLEEHAPEVLSGKGVFAEVRVEDDLNSPDAPASLNSADGADANLLARYPTLSAAMRSGDARERLRHCVEALDAERSAGALLATGSACMEVNDLEAAARILDEAVEQAPAWSAAHFERGKLHLRRDDMERASESFRASAERLPTFGPAWANLGATLGELDRPDEALQAFTTALGCDPASPQTHNNIGVVSRELGKLADSEAAFRRVVALAPDLAFGYYNLGHTLFLQGRYQAALSAYVEGQKRDAERNPVQATRLAMCRLATADAAGAIAELQRATHALPQKYRQQLLADTHSISWALFTHRPDLPGWQQVHDWLTREEAR